MKLLILVLCMLVIGCIELEQEGNKNDENKLLNPVYLNWTTPSRMEDESLIGDDNVAAYFIQWGHAEDQLDNVIEVPWNENSYAFNGLSEGIYYFSVSVETKLGDRSVLSNIVKKVIN